MANIFSLLSLQGKSVDKKNFYTVYEFIVYISNDKETSACSAKEKHSAGITSIENN